MIATFSIGIGCSSRASAEEVIQLIASAIDLKALPSGAVLATVDRRREIAASVATKLGIPVALFAAEILAGVKGTTTYSSSALDAIGTGSVAEAAALAALGPAARLTLARRTGRHCTCAFAEIS